MSLVTCNNLEVQQWRDCLHAVAFAELMYCWVFQWFSHGTEKYVFPVHLLCNVSFVQLIKRSSAHRGTEGLSSASVWGELAWAHVLLLLSSFPPFGAIEKKELKLLAWFTAPMVQEATLPCPFVNLPACCCGWVHMQFWVAFLNLDENWLNFLFPYCVHHSECLRIKYWLRVVMALNA